ncbi:unnamed protein product, partial [Lepidochelys olivacea]
MVYQQQCKQTCLPPPCCVTKCTTKCLDPCCKVCVTKCVTKCVDPCCKVCVKKCTSCVHPCPCPQKCIPSAARGDIFQGMEGTECTFQGTECTFQGTGMDMDARLPTSRKMVYQQQCKQTCLPPPCCVTKCTTKCLDPCCKVCVTKCVKKCMDPCCKVCVKKCTTCVHPCPCPCPQKCAPCPPSAARGGIFQGMEGTECTFQGTECTFQGTGMDMDARLPTSRKMVYQQQCKQTCLPPPCCVTKCTTKCLDPCCKVCVTKCVKKCMDPCCKVCVKKCTTCVHPCPCPCPQKCAPCPPCFPKCPPVEHCCKEKKFCSAARGGIFQGMEGTECTFQGTECTFQGTGMDMDARLPTSRKMVYQQQCKQTCLPPPCCVTKCTTKCLDPCCKVCVTKCVKKCMDPCCKVCVKKCTTCVHPCPCPCPQKCAPCPPCFPKCPPVEHCCKEKKFCSAARGGIFQGMEGTECTFQGTECTFQGTGMDMDARLPTSRKMVYQQQCKQTCLPPPCCVTKCTTKCLDPCCKVCVTNSAARGGIFQGMEGTECTFQGTECTFQGTGMDMDARLPTSRKMVYQQQCKQTCLPPPCCVTKCTTKCLDPCCKVCVTNSAARGGIFQGMEGTECTFQGTECTFQGTGMDMDARLPTSRKMVYQQQCKQTCLPPPCCVTKCTTKCLDPCCKVCVTNSAARGGIFQGMEGTECTFQGTECTFQGTGMDMDTVFHLPLRHLVLVAVGDRTLGGMDLCS